MNNNEIKKDFEKSGYDFSKISPEEVEAIKKLIETLSYEEDNNFNKNNNDHLPGYNIRSID